MFPSISILTDSSYTTFIVVNALKKMLLNERRKIHSGLTSPKMRVCFGRFAEETKMQ
jgi:hypothetical protein